MAQKLKQKPIQVHKGYDPYALFHPRYGSGAMELRLCEREPFHTQTTFYHFEQFRDYMLGEGRGLLITGVQYGERPGELIITAQKSPYRFGRLATAEHFVQAREFIGRHRADFQEKITWNGVPIHTMAENGLNTHKWIAYVLRDEQDRILAYLDYKVCQDTQIEIGIILVGNEDRGKGLAASLVWFLRVLYATNIIYVGTSEENQAMRSIFETTGFHFGMALADRGTPNTPEAQLTNSVYYSANPLLRYMAFPQKKGVGKGGEQPS